MDKNDGNQGNQESEAHKDRMPQFYTLSDEERMRVIVRRKQQLFPVKKLPAKSHRPPKHPNPLVILFPRRPSKPTQRKREVPPNWFKNPNEQIATTSGEKVNFKKTKNEEKKNNGDYEDEEELKNMNAVTHGPVFSNMKELFELNKIFFELKNFQGLEGKIYSVLHKGVIGDFKNGQAEVREPKRNFREWVKDCNDLEQLKAFKHRAAQLAINLSSAVVDIMFLMSTEKKNEMGAKFQVFEDALGWVSKGENTLVISRFLDIIREVDLQLRRMKHQAMAKIRGKKVMIKRKEVDVGDDIDESFVDNIMFSVLVAIFQLELFWSYRIFSCSGRLLAEAIPFLEEELSDFEEAELEILSEIESCNEEGKFGYLSVDLRDSDGYIEMETWTDELLRELEQ